MRRANAARGNAETPPAKPVWTNIPQVPVTDDDVAKCRDAILNALGGDPVKIDDLITWCEQPPALVWAVILEFELAGHLTRHFGNRVSR